MQELSVELLEAYASLFVQRWDQYAVQQRDGLYWRVVEPLSLSHLAEHLAGRWTLGSYVLDASSRCSFTVFDADGQDGLERLAVLSEELLQAGIPALLEASRRGGHLWVHFVEPTPATLVRAWLLPYARALGVELYPKQGWLSPEGSGSLIRMPLGVHQQSRGWYPFVVRSAWGVLSPVGQTVEQCCAWVCQHVQRVVVPISVTQEACPLIVPVHTEHRMPVESVKSVPMASYERFASIRAWCHSQDIEAVIGRYVTLDDRGVGSCPFKDHHYRGDLCPSFQVFGGDDPHWYCYTWHRAGNLFDFLCHYYQITPREAWRQLQQGACL
jgi:hypothetical protein